MRYTQYIIEDQRLLVLRLLSEMPAYKANSSVLRSALAAWGHEPSRDQVKTQLRWLEEQGLVGIEDIAAGVLLITLTDRGQDVAAGRSRVDGVKRPGA